MRAEVEPLAHVALNYYVPKSSRGATILGAAEPVRILIHPRRPWMPAKGLPA
jgi:hypothetical protein